MVDHHDMTIHFRSRRRTTAECKHQTSILIEIAGMSREVCETCGRVSDGVAGRYGTTSAEEPEADPAGCND